MRILFITHYSAMLGANRSLLHLLIALRDHFQVVPLVLAPKEGAFTEELRKVGIAVTVIPFVQAAYTIRSKGLLLFPFRWFWQRKKALKEVLENVRGFKPDWIHSNSSVIEIGWKLSEILSLPHSWHIREFGWEDYQLVFPLGKPRIFRAMRKAHVVIAISNAIALAWNKGGTLPLKVLYNGIGKRTVLQQRGANNKKSDHRSLFNFLIIGLLQPSKRQHEALVAFAKIAHQYPKSRLIITGNGQKLYTLQLKLITRWLGIAHQVIFTGYQANPEPIYRQADVVLMCSRFEAMGRVTAEAMAFGIPVIGFDGGATAELIKHGETGYLYKNQTDLVDLMEKAVSGKLDLEKTSLAAHTFAINHFSDEDYAERFYSFISNK